jgi:hypothetical protein
MITALAGLGMLGAAAAVMHSSKSAAGKALTKDLNEVGRGPRGTFLTSRLVIDLVEKHGFVWLDDTGEIR